MSAVTRVAGQTEKFAGGQVPPPSAPVLVRLVMTLMRGPMFKAGYYNLNLFFVFCLSFFILFYFASSQRERQ